jgi:phosphoserine phosphatase
MVHKSWGSPSPTPAAERTTHTDGTLTRLEARAAAREAQAREREAARLAQRQADAELAASNPHRAAAQRRRGSGRKDVVREQRDTSSYAMIVDPDRVRALAKRGASPASIAAAFDVPVDDIAAILAKGD